jgi:hypothetical protein
MSRHAIVASAIVLVGLIQTDTEPLSPSVLASLAFQDDPLAFAILWRGAEVKTDARRVRLFRPPSRGKVEPGRLRFNLGAVGDASRRSRKQRANEGW